jgi:hypothetical protein
MARQFHRITPIALFIFALMFVGKFSAHSDSSALRTNRPVFDASYRSSSSSHKVIVQSNEPELRDAILAEGGSIMQDYGAFVLMSAPRAAADLVGVQSASGSSVRDDLNVLLLRAGAFDTTEGEAVSANALGEADSADEQLYLVQFVGPIKKQWVTELQSCADIVSYIPNNAYLVRANAGGLARINSLKSDDASHVQWTGVFKPAYKIAPEISLNSDQEITSTIQLVSSANTAREIQDLVARSSASVIKPPTTVLNYTNIRVRVQPRQLADIARMTNVVWIESWSEPVLHDEKQDLILAGKLTGSETPSSYLSWLQSKGITSSPDFIVDVADTGIDQGSLDPQVLHRDFLNSSGLSRVAYARYVGAFDQDAIPQDYAGHGTINASIVGGYNVGSSFPDVDTEGYKFGLGVHPYARLGVSQVFAPAYTNPTFSVLLDKMYSDGARISSNSWGTYNNSYTTDCQTYDSLVRDAQAGVQGNQEMTIVFSSGNKGPSGNLTSPGSAKNTILVGASENLRAGIDGCAIDSTGADDINSLISFSSGGPSTDGRTKPDICAPGTHIQGARSQSRGYNALGVCGPGNYPFGQSLYTWSSGTSHSAPAVAGGAALVRQFFQQSVGHAPSPAMTKAYLTNSSSYMTGVMAGDTLPGANQGWGLMNLGRALDGVSRILVDQDQMLSNTGQVITVQGKIADPSKPFRVTLTWTDAPGSAAATPLVNDLDLQVDFGGQTYLGNHFSGAVSVAGGTPDRLNNLESVWAPLGASGDFTIRIVAANIPGDGVPGNNDLTDQDFALVVYNVQSQGSGGPVDSPPSVSLTSPVGGEHFTVGNTIRIQWSAADDKGLTSQRVEFSPDGVSFSPIATLNGNARSFDWRIPGWPTTTARIRVTVLDGVNLPVSSVSASPFEIVNGPPDTTPPAVSLLSHNTVDPLGGGMTSQIKWRETDNVGVLRRVIEVSLDNGNTYQEIVSNTAPSSGETQTYDWQVPAEMVTSKAKVRITVYDGAGNSATAASNKNFEIWPMPIINDAVFTEGAKPGLELSGRNFRSAESEIWVSDIGLRKIQYEDRYFTGNGTYKHVLSFDKKLSKRVPDRTWVRFEIHNPTTRQVSPGFDFRRKKPTS